MTDWHCTATEIPGMQNGQDMVVNPKNMLIA